MKHPTLPPATSVLFGGARTGATVEDDRPPKRENKTTIYLHDQEVADMGGAILELRAKGIMVDRGRLLRCAFLLAMDRPDEFEAALRRGDGA